MTEPFVSRDQMLQGLGNLLQTPLARGAVRYWWVTAPLGALGWHYWNERKKTGEASIGRLVQDMVPAVGLVATLLTLNSVLEKQESQVSSRPVGPIKDAEFTPAPGPVAAQIVNS